MTDGVYDMQIEEVANVLDKSDRQVRRYVKDNRLKARAMRVGGHIRLMFSREDVLSFRDRLQGGQGFAVRGPQAVVDGRLVGEPPPDDWESPRVSRIDDIDAVGAEAVKYVVDVLREQITELQRENHDLHYQLEQRSGQVGFLQGKVEMLQEEVKMLAPAQTPEQEINSRKPWYRRILRR